MSTLGVRPLARASAGNPAFPKDRPCAASCTPGIQGRRARVPIVLASDLFKIGPLASFPLDGKPYHKRVIAAVCGPRGIFCPTQPARLVVVRWFDRAGFHTASKTRMKLPPKNLVT